MVESREAKGNVVREKDRDDAEEGREEGGEGNGKAYVDA